MPSAIFKGMGIGTQSGKILFKSIYSGIGMSMSSTDSNLSLSIGGHLLSNILFVDPNGDNSTAEFGNIKKPWQSIEGAANYIISNSLTSNPCIYVLPGNYIMESKIVTSQSFSIRLLAGCIITTYLDGLIDVTNCSVKITSESRRDCIIISNSTYFCMVESGGDVSNSGSLFIENTSLILTYQSSSTNSLFFVNSSGTLGRCELNFENCYIKVINNLKRAATFDQGGPSLVSLNDCEIYQENNIPNVGTHHVLFSLIPRADGWTKLSLSNTKINLVTYTSFIFSDPTIGVKNIIYINGCIIQGSGGGTFLVGDSLATTNLVTYGNSIRVVKPLYSGLVTHSDPSETNKSGYFWAGLTVSNSFGFSWA